MENQLTIFEGANPTPSDIRFMHSNATDTLHSSQWLSFSLSESSSSTRSDAQSAPPELEQLFDSLSLLYGDWVVKSGRQLPPQWSMPDLLRFVIGDEAAQSPSLLTEYYYDVVMHGPRSWVCAELLDFIDLIDYVL